VEGAERLHPPAHDVRAGDPRADGERGQVRLGAVVDGELHAVGGEHPLERLDRRPGLGELGAHLVQVVDDHVVARRLVRGVQELAQAPDRQVELAEAADQLGGRDLGRLVEAVARRRVDAGRLQQALVVVVPQRLDRQEGHLRELADAHQARDRLQPTVSPWGRVNHFVGA
jgi:hypothetical protein